MRKFLSILMTVLLLGSLSICAFAAPSPTDAPIFNIVYYSYEDGTQQQIAIDPVENGETVQITANTSGDRAFTGFAIQGQYELVSGTLTDATIVIRPLSDLVITANYENTTPSTNTPVDNGSTSPQTGDSMLILFVALAVVFGAAGCVVATKRLRAKEN